MKKKDTTLLIAIAEGLAEALKGKFTQVPLPCPPDGTYQVRPRFSTISIMRTYLNLNMASSMDLWFSGHSLFYYAVDSEDKIAHELADPEFFPKLAKGVEEWHKSWETMNLQNTSARA